jgi:hypothetical protein
LRIGVTTSDIAHRPGRALAAAALAAVVTLGTLGCSSDDGAPEPPPPEAAGGWARVDVWEHGDVLPFDRVAVGNGTETVSWVSRRSLGDTGALAYTELEGREPTALDLADPAPPAPAPPDSRPASSDEVLIPVAVATGESRWGALAVTRDSPRGDNTGLVAWRGARDAGGDGAEVPAARLALPEGVDGVPDSAGIATSDDATVAVALVGGDPVVWHSTEDPSSSSAATGDPSWEPADEPDLDMTGSLVSLRVTADRDRVVLAAVDASGHAGLWTSSDGEDWSPVDRERLPESVGGVALASPVADGRVVVGWLADEETAPRNASEVEVQSLDGDEVGDEGTVTADGSAAITRLDLNDAVLSPGDRLVLVGAAIRRSSEVTPMVWAQDGDGWEASEQTELAGRIDYEMRAAVATRDTVVALVTNRTHIDVESWRWQAPGDDEDGGD